MRFVLASASSARLATLQAAGIEPEVVVSGVDEDAVLAQLGAASPAEQVIALAQAKALEVAGRLEGAVIVACDSMFEMDGEVRGKPADADDATRRLKQMRGKHGTLHTGHHVIAGGRTVSAAASTKVHIGAMSDADISAYVATGEPLRVAGSFTIDGLGGWFIERLEGDHTNVIGISLPLLRRMLSDVGIDIGQHFTKLT
ncbi:MAG: Maf family protein [Cumulibacter sp.]